jgi:hypothetical protein
MALLWSAVWYLPSPYDFSMPGYRHLRSWGSEVSATQFLLHLPTTKVGRGRSRNCRSRDAALAWCVDRSGWQSNCLKFSVEPPCRAATTTRERSGGRGLPFLLQAGAGVVLFAVWYALSSARWATAASCPRTYQLIRSPCSFAFQLLEFAASSVVDVLLSGYELVAAMEEHHKASLHQ